MTNKIFIEKLATVMNMDTDEVQNHVGNFNALLAECLSDGNSVSVQGFGTIESKQKAERKMFNPTTKAYSIVPAKTSVGFKMSATLKEKVNE